MTAFFMALLSATVIGSLIWLLLTLLRPLTQKVFSQAWHYYTGLIPAFFLIGAAWIISAGFNSIIPLIRTNTFVVTESSKAAISPLSPVFIYSYGGVIEKTGETVAKARLSIEMFVPIILAIWLIGVLLFLSLKIAAYIRFRRGIAQRGRPSTAADCKLTVLICPGIATPMLVGVWRPVIILPEHDYSERERALILMHETAHWRHGDMFIKLFLLTVNALHWFNPLVYRMNKDIARLCENACDETLAKNMDKNERVLYGELILSTVTYKNAPSLCSAMSEGANLKRRLKYMLKSKKMSKPVMILAIMAACGVIAGGVWLYLPINRVAAYDSDLTADLKDNEEAPALFTNDDLAGEGVEDEGSIPVEDDAPINEMPEDIFLWPLVGYTQVSASFGTRIHPIEKTEISHDGIDLAAPGGTPILAAKTGTVIEADYNETDGYYIKLDHDGGQQTFYAHLSEIIVELDDTVKQGDIIGKVGSTGKSTGPHLHFGISMEGVYINPLERFEQ